MSGTVISTYTTAGLVLSNTSQNPITVAQTGEIDAAATNAISGISLASPWTIENFGTLESTWQTVTLGTTVGIGIGISLAGSGIIINGSASDHTADITASAYGIVLEASGTIENFGTIRGSSLVQGGRYSVGIKGDAHIVNGSASDTTAYIGGGAAIEGGSYLANYGTINATIGYAVSRLGGATVVNGSAIDRTALIAGEGGGVSLEGGTLTNFGTIFTAESDPSSYGAVLDGHGLLINDGLITGRGGVIGLSQGDTLINAGTIIGDNGTGNAVYLDAGAGAYAKLIIDPGAVFEGKVAGPDAVTMELASGSSSGTISGLGTQFTDIKTIAIDTGAAWLLSGDSAGLAAGEVISGFDVGDTLVLEGFTATSSIVTPGQVILSDGTVSETLSISTDLTTPEFHISNVADGTEITLCYLRGTHIATPHGDVPVEALAIGDAVVTRFGGIQRIKWLGRQSYDRRFIERNAAKLPVKIAAGALGDGLPGRDLFVSPGHSVLLGGQLVLAHLLVNGVTITQGEAPALVEYIHIEFETHDCVLAEGMWAESFANGPGLRAQCHNAAEFYEFYPDDVTPDALRLCAPRPESGRALEAALLPVAVRAAAMVVPGALRGFIDGIGADGLIRGWARDVAHPELPVLLAMLYRGEVIGTALASAHRADLTAAGLGRCSFSFQAPAGLTPRDVAVCRVVDGAGLALEEALAAKLTA